MGTLYLVGTPIGNLEDITLRALRILKESDLIACEDTRQTAKLLARHGIATPMESYHKFNEAARSQKLVQMLREGKTISLVSDSGMPLISDPGFELVSCCRKEGITIIPVPGPSAALAALTGSGLPADNFFFAGFLPPRAGLRRRRLEALSNIPATLIFYEAPHRILSSLEDMIDILGERRACMARELTKIHEEFLRGTLPEILSDLRARPGIKGEITLVIERGEPATAASGYPDSIMQHLEQEMSESRLPRNEALKSVAKRRGISRRDAYKQLISELNDIEKTEDRSQKTE